MGDVLGDPMGGTFYMINEACSKRPIEDALGDLTADVLSDPKWERST